MGRYIEEILQPGEKVLYSTNEHWMYFLPAIAAWVVVVAFLVLWRLVTADVLMFVCLALAAIAGVAMFARAAAGHCAVKAAVTGESSIGEGLRDQWNRISGSQPRSLDAQEAVEEQANPEAMEEGFATGAAPSMSTPTTAPH